METERAAGKWGVVPWSPEAGKVLGTKAQIHLVPDRFLSMMFLPPMY